MSAVKFPVQLGLCDFESLPEALYGGFRRILSCSRKQIPTNLDQCRHNGIPQNTLALKRVDTTGRGALRRQLRNIATVVVVVG